jgi:molecular chaperone GrpE
MAHVEDTPDVETMKQGMTMILAEFQRTFENLGISFVNAEGAEFNPAEHEAVAQEHSDEVPAGTVIRQWKCGYRLGDKLLRPATVVVSSGPDEQAADKNDE